MKQKSPSPLVILNSKWQSQLGLFYLIGIFGFSLLFFHREVLDYTLLPRYVCASFVFFLTTLFIAVKSINKEKEILWPKLDWPTGLLLSYFVWNTISVGWATNFSEAIFESQKSIIGFSAFYLCRWFQINDVNFIPRLLKLLIVISAGILLLAGWQIFQLDTGLENAHYEVRGICGHKNLFSTVLFLLAGFLSITYFKLKDVWGKIAVLLVFVILLLIIYLKTRSVYLGSLAAIAIFLFLRLRQWLQPKQASILNKSIFVLFAIGLLSLLYLWQTNQLSPILQASKIDRLWHSETGAERLVLWDKTACLIKQSPIWGVGAGNWQIKYPSCSVDGLYSVELDFTTFQRPHNDWLWVWAETGIIGLVCYLGFFLTILKTNLNDLKKEALRTNHLALIARFSIVAGFMIIACFSFPKERIEILLLICTLLALIYQPIQSNQSKNSLYSARMILALIILSAALNLYISNQRVSGEHAMKKVLILKQQKKWQELIVESDNAFSKWYTVDPTTIPIHWHRGTANFVLGKKELALQDYLKAKKYTPFNQHVQNDLGTCYELHGQKEAARKHYKESARISPMFDDPRVNLAKSYYNSGEYEVALSWLNNVQNKDIKEKYRKIILDKQQQVKSEK